MLEIENADLNQLDTYYAIETACFPPSQAASKSAMEARIKTINDTFLIAKKDGVIVGLINGPVTNEQYINDQLFEQTNPNPKTGGVQTVLGLAVDPNYQHQGIAKELLKALEKVARNAQRDSITLTCLDKLIGFYESAGYTNMGESASSHGGVTWYNMVKKL